MSQPTAAISSINARPNLTARGNLDARRVLATLAADLRLRGYAGRRDLERWSG
jgi:hypothetical protein